MKRFIVLILSLLCISLLSGCITGGDDIQINLKGQEEQILTLEDLKELPYVEGYGGRKNSVGQITLPMKYKGVPLTTLYELDHSILDDSAIRIGAVDGYLVTFSYNQFVLGDFITYDEEGNEVSWGKMTIILAYEEDGNPIPEEYGGPLRVAIIADDGPITDGHWWVRFLSSLEAVNIEQ